MPRPLLSKAARTRRQIATSGRPVSPDTLRLRRLRLRQFSRGTVTAQARPAFSATSSMQRSVSRPVIFTSGNDKYAANARDGRLVRGVKAVKRATAYVRNEISSYNQISARAKAIHASKRAARVYEGEAGAVLRNLEDARLKASGATYYDSKAKKYKQHIPLSRGQLIEMAGKYTDRVLFDGGVRYLRKYLPGMVSSELGRLDIPQGRIFRASFISNLRQGLSPARAANSALQTAQQR